jgi:hypothetical protein
MIGRSGDTDAEFAIEAHIYAWPVEPKPCPQLGVDSGYTRGRFQPMHVTQQRPGEGENGADY